MATGSEILVNTLLKAMGYKREDMDAAVQRVLGLQSYVENTLKNLDDRLTRIEENQRRILALLEKNHHEEKGRVIEGGFPAITQ